jgi:hypothetical protein
VAHAAPSERWLFGPGTDLLLGCGLGYLGILALLLVDTSAVRSVVWAGLIPFISVFTGTPHYGATLLRVYEERSERRKYVVFAVWITAAVWAAYAAALYSTIVGSVLLTLYLSWSPWHYSGQNYGIALMFLRRRGIEVTPGLKRCLYLSFILSFGLTLLAIHGAVGGPETGEYASVQPYRGGVFRLLRLGIPSPAWEMAALAVGAGYLACLGAAGTMLLRRAAPADLLPAGVLLLTQAVWFALPPLARHWGWFGEEGPFAGSSASYAFFWVATGHAVQYLWITSYYAARRAVLATRLRYFGKTLLAGSFIWGVPGLIYSWTVEGGAWGGIARGPDVGVLIASAVNLHHFLLDGAIWKLRDGRVARVLIRREPVELPPPFPAPPGRRWLAPAIYAAGACLTAMILFSLTERELRLNPALAEMDLVRARASLKRLERIAHDGPDDYLRAGRAAVFAGDRAEAAALFQRSADKHPSAAAYIELGNLAQRSRRPEAAVRYYDQALEHNPYDANALNQLGLTWLRLDDPARALEYLERAAAIVPQDDVVRRSLERARKRASGDSS